MHITPHLFFNSSHFWNFSNVNCRSHAIVAAVTTAATRLIANLSFLVLPLCFGGNWQLSAHRFQSILYVTTSTFIIKKVLLKPYKLKISQTVQNCFTCQCDNRRVAKMCCTVHTGGLPRFFVKAKTLIFIGSGFEPKTFPHQK